MLSIVKSMSLLGLDGYLVYVQVDVAGGLPGWDIVGLPDVSVKEAKERVRTAIRNSGYELHSRKIVVNMAPASTKKEGSFYDLPIAIGILACNEEIIVDIPQDTVFIGELSLDGKINKANGILSMCIEAKKLGIKKVIVPKQNAKEAAVVKGIKIYGVESLQEVVNFLNGSQAIEEEKIDIEELFHLANTNVLDFSEVKGQENIKRALEISAAGGHNVLLIRITTALGKTMMARRLPSILPDLTFEEALETTKIHSISGILPKDVPLITKRPFRSPHHTISNSSLVRRWKCSKTR